MPGGAVRSETTISSIDKSIVAIAGIDKMLTTQINEILHAPSAEMEGTWRGLWYLVNNTETD